MDRVIKDFPITIYGNIEKFTDVISKARCRIFYRGENRNATYITEDFAEKLISTLPYTPVKGIYDTFNEDYSDHGEDRNVGRIYGIVPEKTNFAWEKHLDEDGVEREYACVDVLLFTALYKEAEEIVGKAQSMELYSPSIKGDWKIINGKRLFEYSDGCFLGLQVLGEDVEPCFEGAAFFSLYNSLKDMIKEIENYSINFHNKKEGGQAEMQKINFKLSDAQKHDAIWTLLNPNYNEEGGWEVTYSICNIYDEYAVCYNYETENYERVYYIKNDNTDSLEITEKRKCYIVDVTEEEKSALDTLQKLNGGTYEKVNEHFEKISILEEEKGQFDTKIGELNSTISTLETEKENALYDLSVATQKISDVETKLKELQDYKDQKELEEKEEIISKYSEQLNQEILDQYKEKISEYTILDLEKDLAYELVNSNPNVFTKMPQKVLKDEGPKSGIEEILLKYRK